MRMRHKPYARPELEAWPYCVNDATALKNSWHGAFANPAQPLRLELGCGKGGFLAATALRDQNANHLGIDIKNEVLVVAKRNIEAAYAAAERPITNVLLTGHNIEQLHLALGPRDTVDRIYINFCNPWGRPGQAKHRLTHPRQLVRCREMLRQDGEIWFKTDDDGLFHDTLRYLPMAGYEALWQTRDLHATEPEWNIRTEHEDMFAAEGIKIKALIAAKRPAVLDKEAIYRWKDV